MVAVVIALLSLYIIILSFLVIRVIEIKSIASLMIIIHYCCPIFSILCTRALGLIYYSL